jgi:hypothetical protein
LACACVRWPLFVLFGGCLGSRQGRISFGVHHPTRLSTPFAILQSVDALVTYITQPLHPLPGLLGVFFKFNHQHERSRGMHMGMCGAA